MHLGKKISYYSKLYIMVSARKHHRRCDYIIFWTIKCSLSVAEPEWITTAPQNLDVYIAFELRLKWYILSVSMQNLCTKNYHIMVRCLQQLKRVCTIFFVGMKTWIYKFPVKMEFINRGKYLLFILSVFYIIVPGCKICRCCILSCFRVNITCNFKISQLIMPLNFLAVIYCLICYKSKRPLISCRWLNGNCYQSFWWEPKTAAISACYLCLIKQLKLTFLRPCKLYSLFFTYFIFCRCWIRRILEIQLDVW
jgi:hypothetical protein